MDLKPQRLVNMQMSTGKALVRQHSCKHKSTIGHMKTGICRVLWFTLDPKHCVGSPDG